MTEDTNIEVTKKPVLDSVESFDLLISFVNTKLYFRGSSLEQWYNQIIFPDISVYADKEELLKLNRIAINYSEIIYKNTAIAKGTLISAKARFVASVQAYKVALLDAIEEENTKGFKKPKPPSEILEARAAVHCKTEQQTLVLAEIAYEFWKCQVEKLQLFNTRLTSMNISIHNDEKYANANT